MGSGECGESGQGANSARHGATGESSAGARLSQPTIVVAGATGDLGARIARELVARGAAVRALVRPTSTPSASARLVALGVTVTVVDREDAAAMAVACEGASCVVSALNGLREVIVERQSSLLDAAVKAGVPRFIPSDYAADFAKTTAGENRNFDLRREFMARADNARIAITSILNGAFMDMLGAEMPIIRPRLRRVLYWGDDPRQPLDFTAKDDVAAYVAAAALDASTPRFLRIAGDVVSAQKIADVMSALTEKSFRPLRVGGLESLGTMIAVMQRLAPQPAAVFPPWQGMQYLRDMYSGKGKLLPLDNDRYPGLKWSKVEDVLASRPFARR